MMKLDKMLVGLDGSDNARRAAEWAAGLAALAGAHVTAVHALGLLWHGREGEVVPAQSVRGEIEARLARDWCRPLADAGVAYECAVRDGNPVSVLLGSAESLDVDLIVVGSRGVGGFPELLLGSTSAQVVQHAGRPVLVVPAAA